MNTIRAAFLLSIDQPSLIPAIPNTMQEAKISFWAMAICLLPMILLHAIEWHADWPVHPRREAAIDLLTYATGWLGFSVLSWTLAQTLMCESRWPRFIALWNWCNLVQYLLIIASNLPELLGAPDWVGRTVELVAQFWALWLEWLAARLALGLPRLSAAAFVAVDTLIGLSLAGVAGLLV